METGNFYSILIPWKFRRLQHRDVGNLGRKSVGNPLHHIVEPSMNSDANNSSDSNSQEQLTTNSYYVHKLVLVLFTVITIPVMLFLAMFLYENGAYRIDDNKIYSEGVHGSYEVVIKKSGSVILLGDSLVDMPCRKFDLIGKLGRRYDYSFGYTNCGVGGNTIQMIRDRYSPLLSNIRAVTHATPGIQVNSTIANRNSSVFVILLWDSDCSGVSEFGLSPTEVTALRERYKMNVRFIVQSILNAGAYMAIGGPGVLPWYLFKSAMLDTYQYMNIELAQEFEMQYIDLRSNFLAAMKSGRSPTIYGDGEHPNNYGTEIIAQLFGQAIMQWKSYSSQISSPTYSSSAFSPTFRRPH